MQYDIYKKLNIKLILFLRTRFTEAIDYIGIELVYI